MKRILFLAVLLALLGVGCASSIPNGAAVTSFYPIYTLAEAVCAGTSIPLVNLTGAQTGCLHDYQLTTGNLRTLKQAGLFLINGAGMENNLMERAVQLYPALPVVDTSQGAYLLDAHGDTVVEEEETHTVEETTSSSDASPLFEDHHGHNHGALNAHIWLSTANAALQAQTIADALTAAYPDQADRLQKNSADFTAELAALQETIVPAKTEVRVLSFHEAFAYLCADFGVTVAQTISIDENQTPSARQLAAMEDAARQSQIDAILCADDAGLPFAQTLSRETGVPYYILDPITTGPASADAYLSAQTANYEILQEVIHHAKS